MKRTIIQNSFTPYYVQLLEILREKISSGEWKAGDKLPSEPELCDIYGVSRTVVRQSLQELEYDGLISRRKGVGTFVAEPKIDESLIQKLTGFYQDMTSRGHLLSTQVLRNEVTDASQKVSDYLQIAPGDPVFCIERLRFVNNEPIVLVTTYLPQALCAGLERFDLSSRSLYDILENELGLELSHGRRVIEAVPANEREALLLQVEERDPMVLLNSVTYLKDGTPIEYYHAVHRGDRSRFEVELQRSRTAGETPTPSVGSTPLVH
jgi:GntR family transcriptional regulator